MSMQNPDAAQVCEKLESDTANIRQELPQAINEIMTLTKIKISFEDSVCSATHSYDINSEAFANTWPMDDGGTVEQMLELFKTPIGKAEMRSEFKVWAGITRAQQLSHLAFVSNIKFTHHYRFDDPEIGEFNTTIIDTVER